MGRPRSTSNTVVARETICIVVGARPSEYHRRNVLNKRTGEMQEIDMTDPGWGYKDPGDEGVPYTFRSGEKVRKDHPAVKQSPHAFVPLDEAEDMNLVEA